jgi:hypothetical protein
MKYLSVFARKEVIILLLVVFIGSSIDIAHYELSSTKSLNPTKSASQTQQISTATSTPTAQTPAQAQSTPATTSSSTAGSSTPSDNCTDVTVPYTTVQQDSTSVQVGQTWTLPGTNGTDRICNGVTTVIAQPFNAIEYIGTSTNLSPAPVTYTPPTLEPYQTQTTNSSGLTEAQATQQCQNNLANGADAADPQGYLITCMHQYGY